ncbi:FkbM family methyltransferase [Parasphingorhabdus pacifica]
MLRGSAALSWAEPELRGLPQLIRPGDVCFDIGAAYGMYSFTLAHLAGPTGAVYSFEPQPKPRRMLKTGVHSCGLRNVRITDAAVGSESGELEMRLPVKFGLAPIHGHAHISDGSRRENPRTAHARSRSWRTPVEMIDEFCERETVHRVDFMKVDAEGFEPNVVTGAEKIITKHRPTLLLEIEDRHLSRYATSSAEFTSSLRTFGYTMYTWNNRTWTPTDAVTAETRNYLFAVDSAWNR